MRRTVLALTLALAGVGAAHSELASSTPADGDVLGAPPAEVRLSFTEPVEVRFSTFKVYPLGTDLGPDAPDAEARLNGLAGVLVSEVLEREETMTRGPIPASARVNAPPKPSSCRSKRASRWASTW